MLTRSAPAATDTAPAQFGLSAFKMSRPFSPFVKPAKRPNGALTCSAFPPATSTMLFAAVDQKFSVREVRIGDASVPPIARSVDEAAVPLLSVMVFAGSPSAASLENASTPALVAPEPPMPSVILPTKLFAGFVSAKTPVPVLSKFWLPPIGPLKIKLGSTFDVVAPFEFTARFVFV